MILSAWGLPGMGLPKFASLMFSLLFLSLSGAPSQARAPGPLESQRTPGQVREVIAPAATVVSTVHYQAELELNCASSFCSGDFPRPGGGRRLNVTRISCRLEASSGSTFGSSVIELQNADASHVLSQFLPLDHSSPSGIHTLNRAVDMQVAARQHIWVIVSLANGTVGFGATCTATGTLDTLQ